MLIFLWSQLRGVEFRFNPDEMAYTQTLSWHGSESLLWFSILARCVGKMSSCEVEVACLKWLHNNDMSHVASGCDVTPFNLQVFTHRLFSTLNHNQNWFLYMCNFKFAYSFVRRLQNMNFTWIRFKKHLIQNFLNLALLPDFHKWSFWVVCIK